MHLPSNNKLHFGTVSSTTNPQDVRVVQCIHNMEADFNGVLSSCHYKIVMK